MYAIVQIGSYQYKVTQGDVIEANRLEGQKGQALVLDKVLFFADDKDIRIGQPYLENVSVEAQVVDHTQDGKRIAFKFRRRKDSAFKKGHRQKLTALNITKIAVK
jgi:large subunit ribosomal protein L21